ncbi:MAG: N,N-dimethylformamidase beta subunit family domain-containing protein [Ilumatobacteraceae bacterium]
MGERVKVSGTGPAVLDALDGARLGVMQGYCWPISASSGGTIEFRMSTAATSYSVRYVQFVNRAVEEVTSAVIAAGGELVAVEVVAPIERHGRRQDTTRTSETGCGQWETDFVLTVPDDWPSGFYAADCVDSNGSRFSVVFVVRPASAAAGRLAVLANTTTWNAYNNWGGYSRYEAHAENRLVDLSFQRPNPETTPQPIDEAPFNADIAAKVATFAADRKIQVSPMKTDESSRHLTRAEMWLVNWLTAAGYPVDLFTDLDLHRGIHRLDRAAALVVHTHPEYWSAAMFTNVRHHLEAAGRLLYLGGNGVYEKVELSDDLTTMRFLGFRGQRPRPWQFSALVGKPVLKFPHSEAGLLGVRYPDDLKKESRAPYRVVQPEHRFFAGTDLTHGAEFGHEGWNILIGASGLTSGAASGWEIDRRATDSPPNTSVLAVGTNADFAAEMTYYEHPAGGFVFSAGSVTFGGSLVVDGTIQRLLANVLDECLTGGDWPGLWPAGIDAALTWRDGYAYAFRGGEYVKLRTATRRANTSYPRTIADNWPGLWPDGIDAAINWGNGKAYFFKADQYLRYDIASDTPDPGYPLPIAGNWPGVWADGIDAAVRWDDHAVMLFRGAECARYDVDADTVVEGYPRPIADELPGVWPEGIDAALELGDDDVALFNDAHYLIWSPDDTVVAAGPEPIVPG